MDNFWEGFEKQALSIGLLRRASDKAIMLSSSTNKKLNVKRLKQAKKFSVAASKASDTEFAKDMSEIKIKSDKLQEMYNKARFKKK